MSGHYTRRYGADRSAPSSTTRAFSSTVEPSTYGTSWNSVRWNKPSTTTGYRSLSSRTAPFESTRPTYSVSPAARSRASQLASAVTSMGPSVSSRASRFDSTVQDKYRSEARDLLSKIKDRTSSAGESSYLARPRYSVDSNSALSSRYQAAAAGGDYPYRKSASATPSRTSRFSEERSLATPSRNYAMESIAAKYASGGAGRSSVERSIGSAYSPSVQSHTLRSERPWRARMAENSRLRSTLGDDAAGSYVASRASRRGSLSQASDCEGGGRDEALRDSISQLRALTNTSSNRLDRDSNRRDTSYTPSSYRLGGYSNSVTSSYSAVPRRSEEVSLKQMSRSYSPVRKPLDLSTRPSLSRDISRDSREPSSEIRDRRSASRQSGEMETSTTRVSTVPATASIRESSLEGDAKRKRRGVNSRRSSRQRSTSRVVSGSSSSGDDDWDQKKNEARKRRRAKRRDSALPPKRDEKELQNTTTASSMCDLNKEKPDDVKDVPKNGQLDVSMDMTESFYSCGAPSPREPEGSPKPKPGKVKMVKNKTTIIKSPSVVEVPGIKTSDLLSVKTDHPINKNLERVASIDNSPRKADSPISSDWMSTSEYYREQAAIASDASYSTSVVCGDVDEDKEKEEGGYGAVAHFKPKGKATKRAAPPVPGLWKKEGEAFISRNKHFKKEDSSRSASIVWKIRDKAICKKNVKAPAKKKAFFRRGSTKKKEEKEKEKEEKPVEKLEVNAPDLQPVKELSAMPMDVKEVEPKIEKKEDKKNEKKEEKKEEVNAVLKSPKVLEKDSPKVVRKVESPKASPKVVRKESPKTSQTVEKKAAEKKPDIERAVKEPEIDPVEEEEEEEMVRPPRKLSPTKKILPVVEKSITSILNRSEHKDKTEKVLPLSCSADVTNLTTIREKRPPPKLAIAAIDKELSRRSAKLAVTNTIFIPLMMVAQLACRAPSLKEVRMEETVKRREKSARAQVTVLSAPILGVNRDSATLKAREKRRSLPLKKPADPPVEAKDIGVEFEKAKQRALQLVEGGAKEGGAKGGAAEILDEMRQDPGEEQYIGLEDIEDERHDGPLILPDQSLLEEYVNRKRNRMERLHSEPIRARSASIASCASPAHSTTSELMPATSVRVYGPSERGVPQYTVPSRASTRMSSVEVEGPSSTCSSFTATSSFNNFNATPQAFGQPLRPRPVQHLTATAFEEPKSPFEQRLQNAANLIRRHSSTTIDENRVLDPSASIPALSSGDEMPPTTLSSQFTNAVAQQQRGEARYAAHLPVRGGSESGRTSATSLAEDGPARHQQHRAKFKEAIDYLDQIFEDLKKECEVPPPTTSEENNNKQLQQQTSLELPRRGSVKTARDALQGPASDFTGSLPNRSNSHRQHRPVKAPSPLEVTFPQKVKPVEKVPSPPEVEVSETIVLPTKTDKLDFTRRWLTDDLASFSRIPAPIINEGYTDVDEHSLGSCSAEVAAINMNTRAAKSSTSVPQQPKPKKQSQPAPIRPQPQRAQPAYNQPAGGLQPQPSISRVPSFDRMSGPAGDVTTWRANSQEPYQTLQSVRSEDHRPSPSAFQNVPSAFSSRGGLRGSIRSLPDAGLARSSARGYVRDDPAHSHQQMQQQQQHMVQQQAVDPVLAIDALCAELELNVEQPMSASEKRRSFPTTFGRAMETMQTDRHQAPARPQPQPPQRSFQGPQPYKPQPQFAGQKQQPVYAQPVRKISEPHGGSRVQQAAAAPNQKLEEVTNMLNNVVHEIGNQQRRKPSLAPPSSNSMLNPFETINQERLAPSRVEAIQNMFEHKGDGRKHSSPSILHSSPQPFYRNNSGPQGYGRGSLKAPPTQTTPPRVVEEESNYYDLAAFSVNNTNNNTNNNTSNNSNNNNNNNNNGAAKPRPGYNSYPQPYASPQAQQKKDSHPSSLSQSFASTGSSDAPAYPTTQPPAHPPNMAARNGSCSSSQNGGYYSSGSGSSLRQIGASRRSISSRAPSVDEDEDDGFYDNIGVYSVPDPSSRRQSRCSDFDAVSMSSQRHPPQKKGLGGLLRRIGGGRPPGAAASLVSLNRMPHDTPIHPPTGGGSLMKSSSLSGEPWKRDVMENGGEKRSGLGSRIKNSLFGSKKRLNG